MLPLHHIGVTLRFSPRAKWRTSVKRFCLSIRHSARLALLTLPLPLAVLSFNQPGPGAGDLIDAGVAVTDVRLEMVEKRS